MAPDVGQVVGDQAPAVPAAAAVVVAVAATAPEMNSRRGEHTGEKGVSVPLAPGQGG